MTDCISNYKLYNEVGPIPLSRAIIGERIRWLGHILIMNNDRFPKISLNGQIYRDKQKTGCFQMGRKCVS